MGDRVGLTLGTDGNGKIGVSGGKINSFDLDDVTVELNGGFLATGSVTGIYISGYTELTSTLLLEVPAEAAWTKLEVDGVDLINGTDDRIIELEPLLPDSGGVLNLNNPGTGVWYKGGVWEYRIYHPAPTPTPSMAPTLSPTPTPPSYQTPTPSFTPIPQGRQRFSIW